MDAFEASFSAVGWLCWDEGAPNSNTRDREGAGRGGNGAGDFPLCPFAFNYSVSTGFPVTAGLPENIPITAVAHQVPKFRLHPNLSETAENIP